MDHIDETNGSTPMPSGMGEGDRARLEAARNGISDGEETHLNTATTSSLSTLVDAPLRTAEAIHGEDQSVPNLPTNPNVNGQPLAHGHREQTSRHEVKLPLEQPVSCPICIDEMAEFVTTACNHAFHDECLNRWLLEQDTCPICRYAIIPLNADTATAPDAPILGSATLPELLGGYHTTLRSLFTVVDGNTNSTRDQNDERRIMVNTLDFRHIDRSFSTLFEHPDWNSLLRNYIMRAHVRYYGNGYITMSFTYAVFWFTYVPNGHQLLVVPHQNNERGLSAMNALITTCLVNILRMMGGCHTCRPLNIWSYLQPQLSRRIRNRMQHALNGNRPPRCDCSGTVHDTNNNNCRRNNPTMNRPHTQDNNKKEPGKPHHKPAHGSGQDKQSQASSDQARRRSEQRKYSANQEKMNRGKEEFESQQRQAKNKVEEEAAEFARQQAEAHFSRLCKEKAEREETFKNEHWVIVPFDKAKYHAQKFYPGWHEPPIYTKEHRCTSTTQLDWYWNSSTYEPFDTWYRTCTHTYQPYPNSYRFRYRATVFILHYLKWFFAVCAIATLLTNFGISLHHTVSLDEEVLLTVTFMCMTAGALLTRSAIHYYYIHTRKRVEPKPFPTKVLEAIKFRSAYPFAINMLSQKMALVRCDNPNHALSYASIFYQNFKNTRLKIIENLEERSDIDLPDVLATWDQLYPELKDMFVHNAQIPTTFELQARETLNSVPPNLLDAEWSNVTTHGFSLGFDRA